MRLNKATAERYVRERRYFTATCLVKASDLSSDLFLFFGNSRVDDIPSPLKNHQRETVADQNTCVQRERSCSPASINTPHLELYNIWLVDNKFTHPGPFSSFPLSSRHKNWYFQQGVWALTRRLTFIFIAKRKAEEGEVLDEEGSLMG